MGLPNYNTTIQSFPSIISSSTSDNLEMTDSQSEKLITSSNTGSLSTSSSTTHSKSSITKAASFSPTSSTYQQGVVVTLNNSDVLTLGGVTRINTTTLSQNTMLQNISTFSVEQYSSADSTVYSTATNASANTHTVTNIFSDIETVTILNSSHVTTQTLPNSELTTKTLSDQIMTLGVPVATYTTVLTGMEIETSLTTPLYLSGTTLFPDYGFEYTQFFIITSDNGNKKREAKTTINNDKLISQNTVMELLINVPTQPLTKTITTDLKFYKSSLKGMIDPQNMVVLYNHGSSSHLGLSKGAKIGAILGGVFGGLGLCLILITVFLKYMYHTKYVDEEQDMKNPSDNDTIQQSKSNMSMTDGFSHHSGRRINVFEETEFLDYAINGSQRDNLFFKTLDKLRLKSAFKRVFFINNNKDTLNEIVDPYNDEFDFKNRHLEPPIIVDKSARDIVNEGNPFSDIHESSLQPGASLQNQLSEQDISLVNMTNELSFRNDNSSDNQEGDDNSIILDTVSMSTLSPRESIKRHGMLKEVFL
ncbi:hypothetical protein ACO0R3_004027 [Hanseniaspora guilliermondii]